MLRIQSQTRQWPLRCVHTRFCVGREMALKDRWGSISTDGKPPMRTGQQPQNMHQISLKPMTDKRLQLLF